MKFSELCRLCLGSERIFIPLYNNAEKLEEKINCISSRIEIRIGDNLPAQVCHQCVELVNTCYNFILQIENSDDTLRQYINKCSQLDDHIEEFPQAEELSDGDNSVSLLSTEPSTHLRKQKLHKPSQLSCSSLNASNKEVEVCKSVRENPRYSSENGKSENTSNFETDLIPGIYIQEALYYGSTNTYQKTFTRIAKGKSRISLPVKYHQCAVCGKSVQKLNLHMKMHTGEKPYQCSVCGQRFIQKGSLSKHNTLHTGERPYNCSLCGKTFRCKSDLNQHTKLHTGNAHTCSICKKEFTTRQNLESHMRTHTGEKPFLCHTCGMHFAQKGALTKHSRIHANDRPHQCSMCNKRFITQSALNKHFRTHTGEKPYTCATCQKSFTDRGYFMRHLMIHSGEKSFVCSVCGKAFTQQISMKRHLRLHTGEKPFHCPLCGDSFYLRRDLKRHNEKFHDMAK
ncbi:gastrula zinc finger protein XlCGF57.1-like isoform X1 [Periplaneta americana]|uniref:gastrula zinc finger protein XlCGF57.1-like isoform X1 n=1 Tax=Periplaneta americana TaxID=6978 RepID=UPI0037E9302C